MTDLITGGAGFVGFHLANALLDRGNEVRVLVKPSSPYQRFQNNRIRICLGDIREPESLIEPLRGVDRVFHCAALVTDWGDSKDFRDVNVRGTENLLSACKHITQCRFLHISTTDVYGHPDKPVDETAPFKYRNIPYSDSKIDAEKKIWKYVSDFGLAATVVRAGNVYGVDSVTFVSDIIDLLKNGDMVHLGRKLKPAGLCHVDNLISAIILAAENKNSIGEAYNILDGSDITWRQFVNSLADITGARRPRIIIPRLPAYFIGWCMESLYKRLSLSKRPLLTRMAVELFTTNQGFSIEKACKELGYNPTRTFASGMNEIASQFGMNVLAHE